MDDKVKAPGTPTSPPCIKTTAMLQGIATATSGCISEKYFNALVSSLSKNLEMGTVLIGELTGDKTPSIQTKAVIVNGELIDNFNYELAGTPCENTLDKKYACYPENVQQAFPADKWLKDRAIEGYIGAALIASSGAPMGVLVACSQSPIKNVVCVKASFDMVVARTAAEMERMHTEERLRELLQVVEQSPVVIAKADINRNLDYVNKNFESTTGYTKEEVLGKDPRFLTEGVTSDKVYKDIWNNITQGKVWSGEILNKRKNGSHFWAKATFGALRNASGEITGYISLKEEITQLKESEKHLRLAASVFETASEALVVTDVNMNIKMVNKAFSNITGYGSDEAIGQTPAILQSGRQDKDFYADMFDSLNATDVWEGEIWNRRKNGEIYPEWLRISVIRDDVGNHEGYVGLFSDITKRKRNESLIQHQANFDALTGLPNRNLFRDRLSHALDLAEKNHQHVAVLFIDIDHFKYVNETLGHSLGDQLLQDIANRLTHNLKKPKTVSRFGGDEFIVILPDESSLYRIENTALEILKKLERPYCINGDPVFASASIGAAVYPFDGEDAEALLRKAENAMYKAKHKGRNNFQFFTMEMDIEAQQRQELERDLHKAIEKKQLSLVYQPIIDPATGTMISAEALIRWQHPKKGLISPVQFIPLAEEVGLIIPIGEWVLREACREAMRWVNTPKPPTVSVNLSSIQFQKQNVPNLVKTILAETQLPPERLTLEITESLLVIDDDDTLEQLQEIRRLGINLSIDDFGTGYSSLSYLKKFPVSTLKIDRSFIMGLPDNSEDEALVSAILAMANSLNLTVVAEGVETQEQAELLKRKGCQYLQGYYFSKPLAKDAFEGLLLQ
jgi:diguanylate cyclase (GGDEF)-like protein/PAS domain S-box-containing protein